MPITAKAMIKRLKSNGYTIVSQNGSHIKLTNSEKNTVIVPNHKNDLPIGTEQAILKQAGLK